MSIIEFIRDRARYYNCPVCGKRLDSCEIRMLNHVDDRFTVQVTCGACQVAFIVILGIQGAAVDSIEDAEIEVEVELAGEGVEETGEEVAYAGPIEVDEVLDVHLMLRDHRGKLTELLRQPEPR